MPVVPILTLQHYYQNPRYGDVTAIARSLKEFGQFRPIVVNVGSITGRPNEVLAGNHTMKAALSLDWDEIEVDYVDVDEQAAAKINLIDNRSGDLSDYDHDALDELISSLSGTEGTGYESANDAEDAGSATVKREAPKQVKPSGGQGMDQFERYDAYKESETRHLFLEWTVNDFDRVEENLRTLRKAWSMNTSEVVRKLIDLEGAA